MNSSPSCAAPTRGIRSVMFGRRFSLSAHRVAVSSAWNSSPNVRPARYDSSASTASSQIVSIRSSDTVRSTSIRVTTLSNLPSW